MIKSFIILVLLIVLSAGMFLTRPTKESFAQHVKQQQQASAEGGLLGKITAQVGTDWYVDSCTFKDNFLWTEMQRNGQTMFYGVFGRWWGSDPSLKPTGKSP